jgi:signal transduction histidine kinase
MKSLTEFLNESLNEANETIKSEKDFREAARAKFEEVFGDELDEDKMNKTIDGLLDDNKELVERGEWGELIGMLNKSFAPGNKDKE